MSELKLVKKGKVRDVYQIDDRNLLIVASDRISAFDVVMPNLIPGKGAILTEISKFWFDKTQHIIINHTQDVDIQLDYEQIAALGDTPIGNMMFVKALYPIPIEAIVRGYLIGSAWKEYQETGKVGGILFPAGMRFGKKFEEPIFTPTTKAPDGEHDTNISIDDVIDLVSKTVVDKMIEASLSLYNEAYNYLFEKGIVLIDTKFEFGFDPSNGRLVLMDELFTPDSSRFCRISDCGEGNFVPMDKQVLRQYLESIGWDKKPPAPILPENIVNSIIEKYTEIRDIILA